MIRVVLTNFGTVIYQGYDLEEAKIQAVKTGFECTMTLEQASGEYLLRAWSPIGGWRTIL